MVKGWLWRESAKTKTTIKSELSMFRSIISAVAINDTRVISNMPDIPKILLPPSEVEHRRIHVGFDE